MSEQGSTPMAAGQSLNICDGTRLIVRTATGERLQMIATGRPVRGKDFPVVWVCSASDYEGSAEEVRERSVPWPLDEVEVDRTQQVADGQWPRRDEHV